MIPANLVLIYVSKLMQEQSSEQFSFPLFEKRVKEVGGVNIMSIEEKDVLREVISEVSDKGILPNNYVVATIEFAIVWYYFACLFVSTMAIIYYRKFKAV
jgi:hypothetical protein